MTKDCQLLFVQKDIKFFAFCKISDIINGISDKDCTFVEDFF